MLQSVVLSISIVSTLPLAEVGPFSSVSVSIAVIHRIGLALVIAAPTVLLLVLVVDSIS